MDLNDWAVGSTYDDGFVMMLSEDCGVRLRAAGSQASQNAREAIYEPYQAFTKLPDDLRVRLTAQWLAKGIVVEWIGPWKVGGKDFPKSDPVKVAEILSDKRYRPLTTKLLAAAMDDDNYRERAEAAAEKN